MNQFVYNNTENDSFILVSEAWGEKIWKEHTGQGFPGWESQKNEASEAYRFAHKKGMEILNPKLEFTEKLAVLLLENY